mgnify:CR=1 FL=1
MSLEKKIDPLGFREYDARWLFPESINEQGIEHVGKGFGTQVVAKVKNPTVIVGHDYRSYSENVKKNFIKGLLSTGCNVKDIGLCLSPTVYFSQFKLNADAVAMVTASHNENGWTGIKMGIEKGLTHCKDEMSDLKNIVLNEKFVNGNFSINYYGKLRSYNRCTFHFHTVRNDWYGWWYCASWINGNSYATRLSCHCFAWHDPINRQWNQSFCF